MKPKKLLKKIATIAPTPEFIREMIYHEFPELVNKPQPFKDGELIQCGDAVVKIVDIKKGLANGFCYRGVWYENSPKWSFKSIPELWKPADPEIWKQKLIEECKKRGIWDTLDVEALACQKNKPVWTEEYFIREDELWSSYGLVYKKGKFATPSIPQYTKEEAEQKFKFKMI